MSCEIENRSCKVILNSLKSRLVNKGFGVKRNNYLELDLFETMYLLEKGKIEVSLDNKKINLNDFEKYSCKKIKNFKDKYLVYKDLKEKGHIIKDGAIFGFDFRVYDGKSKTHEHTKYVLDVKRTHKDEMSKVIKSERLANSIKTKYVIAIIDLENKITKIKLERI